MPPAAGCSGSPSLGAAQGVAGFDRDATAASQFHDTEVGSVPEPPLSAGGFAVRLPMTSARDCCTVME
jgi:hypothetical protein